MHKSLPTALAITLSLAVAVPARAWEPMPNQPVLFTSVVRILDTALIDFSTQLLVSLSDPPAGVCAANQGQARVAVNGGALTAYAESWISVEGQTPTALAFLMAAKAQNLSIRVVMWVPPGLPCRITDMRTCTDAASCAVPGLPGN